MVIVFESNTKTTELLLRIILKRDDITITNVDNVIMF